MTSNTKQEEQAKAEPTGALPIGALLTRPNEFRGKSVCCVITGRNVDGEIYGEILKRRSI